MFPNKNNSSLRAREYSSWNLSLPNKFVWNLLYNLKNENSTVIVGHFNIVTQKGQIKKLKISGLIENYNLKYQSWSNRIIWIFCSQDMEFTFLSNKKNVFQNYLCLGLGINLNKQQKLFSCRSYFLITVQYN